MEDGAADAEAHRRSRADPGRPRYADNVGRLRGQFERYRPFDLIDGYLEAG